MKNKRSLLNSCFHATIGFGLKKRTQKRQLLTKTKQQVNTDTVRSYCLTPVEI